MLYPSKHDTDESKKLANYIVKNLKRTSKFKNRGVKKRKNLAVLNGTKVPAVLVEVGYMSNSSDIKRIVSGNAGRNGKAISRGIEEYFKKGN